MDTQQVNDDSAGRNSRHKHKTNIIKRTTMIRLNCFVKLNDAAHRDEVIEHAKALVAATLANDKGCVAYDFFASATHDDVFMFCETWADEETLAVHSNAAHFKEHVSAIEKYAAMKLEKMEL